jgi:hypothetical protein
MQQIYGFQRSLCLLLTTLIFAAVYSPESVAAIDPETVVGMWLFEEGGGDISKDSSGKGNDGKIAGPKKWKAGKFGQALEFNGVDVYVEVESNDTLVLEELTIVAWANLKNSKGTRWQSIMMKGQNPRNYLLTVDKDTQTLQLSITKGAPDAWGGPIGVGGPVITDEKWHHLAGVIGQQAGLAIYVDGQEVGKQAYAKPSLNADPARVRIGDGSAGGHQADGLIDEVGLFSVPLEPGDIVTVMEKGLEAATGLLAVNPQGKLAARWGEIKAAD